MTAPHHTQDRKVVCYELTRISETALGSDFWPQFQELYPRFWWNFLLFTLIGCISTSRNRTITSAMSFAFRSYMTTPRLLFTVQSFKGKKLQYSPFITSTSFTLHWCCVPVNTCTYLGIMFLMCKLCSSQGRHDWITHYPIVSFAGKAMTLARVLGMQNGRSAVDAAKDVVEWKPLSCCSWLGLRIYVVHIYVIFVGHARYPDRSLF